MLRMAERDGERIGRIGGEPALDLEQCTHHVGHLQLVRGTGADGRELHRTGRVLRGFQAPERGKRGTARLPQFEGAVDVAADEHALHRDLGRRPLRDERGDAGVDARQPLGDRQPIDLDPTVVEAAAPRTFESDDAETGAARTGIEAEDAAIVGVQPQRLARRHRGDADGGTARHGIGTEGAPGLRAVTRHSLRAAKRMETAMIARFPAGNRVARSPLEVVEKLSPQALAALTAGEAQLHAAGLDAAAIARGAAAARITAALTDDASLALGVLLHEARPPGDDRDHGTGPDSVAVAAELARLGVTHTAQWDDTGGLHGDQAEVLRKMLLGIVTDPRLVVARIALQLARLRAARDLPADERRRLAQEARAVFAPLANRLGVWQVKWELEDLAFRWLEPEGYQRIARALAERRTDRERYIDELCDTLRAALSEAGIHGEVQGRAKHIYSIHRKMQRKQLEFERLSDVRAVRIVCDTVPECYAALGVVHGRWNYLPGEFDDYIATPKDNFYRSIHTAVLGPLGKTVEVQIRTREMHRQSELGVAAHWRYKEGSGRDDGYARKIEWVRRLLEPVEHGEGPPRGDESDFIERVRAELFEDRVYALTPKGEVVDLPRGATPLDFAYQVHTSLGHRCRGAKVNGRIVPLTQVLANGQVVDIITGKHESPSRDWLVQDGYLISPRSRAKLRAWFRRADAGENESAGRGIAERELSRLGLGLEVLPALAHELKAGDVAQLHRWLGEGEVGVAAFVQAAMRTAPQRPGSGDGSADTADGGTHTETTPAARAVRRRAGTAAKRRGSGPVLIEGIGDLPITLARCCGPIPPEPVAGYVTVGRGVTVHAARCPSLSRMRDTHPDRVLRVDWRDTADGGLPVDLRIEAWDRRGLVRDLGDVVAAAGLGIEQLTTTTDRAAGTATLTLRTEVRDLEQLAKLLRALDRIPNVISARRSG